MNIAVRPDFLTSANIIGITLCRDALWAGEKCNWLGASAEQLLGRLHVVQRTYGPDLYNGTSGIALFLAELHARAPDPILRKTAIGAIEHAAGALDLVEKDLIMGFYSGAGGVAYVLLRLALQFDRLDWIQRGVDMLERHIEPNIEALARRDVVMGAAGVIPLLIAASRRFDRPGLLQLAQDLGDQLLAKADQSDLGWSWRTTGVAEGDLRLTGFSHGAAGIAWSLLELHAATGSQRFFDAANEGFRYERSWYDGSRRNWPDLRSSDARTPADVGRFTCGNAWCHGGPGIALSRIRAYELTGDESYKPEIKAGVETAIASLHGAGMRGDSFCLCHGAGGNAELLLEVDRVLGDPPLRAIAEATARDGIALQSSSGACWKSGVLDGARNPSLLLGDAGIGFFFLRLHAPRAVPSILLPHPGTLFAV